MKVFILQYQDTGEIIRVYNNAYRAHVFAKFVRTRTGRRVTIQIMAVV